MPENAVAPEMIEQIRRQESQKYHSQIAAMQQELEQLRSGASGQQASPEASVLSRVEGLLERLVSLQQQPGKARPAVAEDTVREIRETLDRLRTPAAPSGPDPKLAELTAKLQELEQRNAESLQQLQTNNLRLWKLQAIQEVGAPVIEELVVGNSPEEIRAAAKAAADKYKEIASAVEARLRASAPPPAITPANELAGQQNAAVPPAPPAQPAPVPPAPAQPSPAPIPAMPGLGSGPEPLTSLDANSLYREFLAATPEGRLAMRKDPVKWERLTQAAEHAARASLGAGPAVR